MHTQEPNEAGPSRPIKQGSGGTGAEARTGLGGDEREQQAALVIQKHYRGHQARRELSHVKL
jgi:hypothetical protein